MTQISDQRDILYKSNENIINKNMRLLLNSYNESYQPKTESLSKF